MKKNKKWLSVLLAVCMVLTTLVPAFSAFAAEKEQAVTDFEKLVTDNSKWNDDIKKAYDALSDDQKNSVDPVITGKAMNLAIEYAKSQSANKTYQEAYPKAYTEVLTATDELKKAITVNSLVCGYPVDMESLQIGDKTYSKAVLMEFTDFNFKEEMTVGETKVTVEDQKAIFDYILNEFNSLEGWQQDLFGVMYAYKEYKTQYNYVIGQTNKNLSYVFALLELYEAKYMAENAIDPAAAEVEKLKEVEAAALAAVTFKGKIGEALTAFLALRPEFETYAAIENPTEEQQNDFMDNFVPKYRAIVPERADVVTETVWGYAIGSAMGTFIVYNGELATTSSLKYAIEGKVKEINNKRVVAEYEAFMATINEDEITAENIDAILESINKEFAKLDYDQKKLVSKETQDKKTRIEGMKNALVSKTFEDKVNAVAVVTENQTEEYRTTVNALKEEYGKLDKNVKAIFDATEAYKHLNELVASIGKELLVNTHEDPVLETVPGKDNIISDIISSTVAPNLNGLLPFVAKLINANAESDSLVGTVAETYFNNETLTALAKMVYPAIDPLFLYDAGIIQITGNNGFGTTPDKVAKGIESFEKDNPQFTKAIEQLKAAGTKIEDWDKIETIDWGVIPGDYETFINGLFAALAGLNGDGLVGPSLLNKGIPQAFSDTYSMTPDGASIDYSTYRYGFYSRAIVPIFEMLGVKDYPATLDYSKAALSEKNAFKATLKPIFDVLWNDVLPRLEADPAGFLGEYLPSLIYHLDDGCIFDSLDESLNVSITVIIVQVNLRDTINGILAPMGIENLGVLDLHKILELALGSNADVDVEAIYSMLKKVSTLGTEVYKVSNEDMAFDSFTMIKGDEASVINYVLDIVYNKLPDLGINIDFLPGAFVPVALPKYPHNGDLNKDVVNKTIAGLDETVLSLVKLDEVINNAVATNENAALLLKALYGELAKVPELVQMGIAVTPAQVAAALGDAKEYKELVAVLEKAATWDDVVLTIKNDKGEVKYQTNMGFTDGDFDGFVNAVVAYLRPLAKTLINTGMFLNNGAEGSYGLYETLIVPVYEALGLTISSNSATLTKMYADAVKAMGEDAACDVVLKEVLAPVLDLVADVKAAPVSTVLDKLPTLAYALQYNPDVAFIGNMLKNDKGEIDLAAMINPMLADLGIVLPYIDLDLLASAGTVKDLASASLSRDTYKAVVADKADAFIVVMNYVGDTIKYGKNLDAIKNLLKDVDLGSLDAVVTDLLGKIGAMSNDELICMLATMFGGYTCPDAAEGEGGDGEIGDMGDYAVGIGSVLAVFAAAGVALVLLRRRKKVND